MGRSAANPASALFIHLFYLFIFIVYLSYLDGCGVTAELVNSPPSNEDSFGGRVQFNLVTSSSSVAQMNRLPHRVRHFPPLGGVCCGKTFGRWKNRWIELAELNEGRPPKRIPE